MHKEKIDRRKLAKASRLDAAINALGSRDPDRRTGDERRQWAREKSWISPFVVTSAVRLVEVVIVVAIGFAVWMYYVLPNDPTVGPYYMSALLVTAGLVPIVLQTMDLYTVMALRSFPASAVRVFLGLSGLFAIFLLFAFFIKISAEYSRVWLASWFGLTLAALLMFRGAVSGIVRHWNAQGRLERSAVIVGGGNPTAELIRGLDGLRNNDIRITGIFDDRNDERSPGLVEGHRKLGTIDELVDFARRVRVDLLIVSFPITAEKRLLEVLRKLWVLPVDIRLSAHTNKLRFRPRTYSYIGNIPFLDIFDKPLADWDHVVKTLEDRIVAVLALILLSPVMALVALAIKLDSRGPVFFKQNRFGFNNEMIGVYKFRSMYQDAADQKASKLVTKNDPRVTRVGRFIRKTSLDELPQLFNVLRGELSLVGPRPHAEMAKAADKLYTEVVDGYFARHRVKPGITGWAQVNGWRGETDTRDKIERRVEHDLYYIENWSLLFDFYILAVTPFALMNTESAY